MYLRLSVPPLFRCDVHDISADGCAAVRVREEACCVDVGRRNFRSQRLEFIDWPENAINHLARWVSIGPRRMGKLYKLL
jgi:hypothetical protein